MHVMKYLICPSPNSIHDKGFAQKKRNETDNMFSNNVEKL